MFLGLLGADQCYLGFWRAAVLMLATLGGSVCGISTTLLFGFCPVYGWDMYRLAIDLPLWQFLIILIAVLFFIAFTIGGLPLCPSFMARIGITVERNCYVAVSCDCTMDLLSVACESLFHLSPAVTSWCVTLLIFCLFRLLRCVHALVITGMHFVFGRALYLHAFHREALALSVS